MEIIWPSHQPFQEAFFAADAMRDVKLKRDTEYIRYAMRSIIITGMALNKNRTWEEKQLNPAFHILFRSIDVLFKRQGISIITLKIKCVTFLQSSALIKEMLH